MVVFCLVVWGGAVSCKLGLHSFAFLAGWIGLVAVALPFCVGLLLGFGVVDLLA